MQSNHTFSVPSSEANQRIDLFLVKKFPSYSRTYFQKLVFDGHVVANGSVVQKPSFVLKGDEEIIVTIPPLPPLGVPKPFEGDLGVRILFEHPQFFIIYKPAGLMVHAPLPEANAITLVDWLLKKFQELASVGMPDRPGIVHRLDKDTSGLMVIPRNNFAHTVFGDLFKSRYMQKTYLAVVRGQPADEGVISFPIARHPTMKNRMTHVDQAMAEKWRISGRNSTTYYRVLERFDDAALVEVKPVTGRTHQIRVHFAAISHPLIGDAVYGAQSKLISRQALHATALAFAFENEPFSFTEPAPADFQELLEKLRKLK